VLAHILWSIGVSVLLVGSVWITWLLAYYTAKERSWLAFWVLLVIGFILSSITTTQLFSLWLPVLGGAA